jgi:hypothetical protein
MGNLRGNTNSMVALITGAIGIATAITIVILIRKDHLHVRYGLWWAGAATAFAFLGLFPAIFDNVAKYVGIARPPILALTLAVSILVIKILVMDIERSRNAIRMQRLIQRLALLESDLREMQGKPPRDDNYSNHGELDEAKHK